MKLQKAGGCAAFVEALAYIVGFVFALTILNPGNTRGWSAAQKLGFVIGRQEVFQLWMLFIYVVFGIALVVLVVALHERLKTGMPGLMQPASAFGLIWAGLVVASGMVGSVGLEAAAAVYVDAPEQAGIMWRNINVIQDGLGGGVEVVGGLWVLLVSIAALYTGIFSKVLNYIGIAVGLFGLLTIVPALGELGAVFGLGQIVWFLWLGVSMLRHNTA